mmetsp:Transcript_31266/g.96811  ORF Transcript_31266/g.96811 Transcript_31266/m.96811 type:complete len:87 (-) Transcript_31266:420-680(-)
MALFRRDSGLAAVDCESATIVVNDQQRGATIYGDYDLHGYGIYDVSYVLRRLAAARRRSDAAVEYLRGSGALRNTRNDKPAAAPRR